MTGSSRGNRRLQVGNPVALVVVLAAAFAVRAWQEAGEARRIKDRLLEDVRTAVQQEPPDGS